MNLLFYLLGVDSFFSQSKAAARFEQKMRTAPTATPLVQAAEIAEQYVGIFIDLLRYHWYFDLFLIRLMALILFFWAHVARISGSSSSLLLSVDAFFALGTCIFLVVRIDFVFDPFGFVEFCLFILNLGFSHAFDCLDMHVYECFVRILSVHASFVFISCALPVSIVLYLYLLLSHYFQFLAFNMHFSAVGFLNETRSCPQSSSAGREPAGPYPRVFGG